ncbi:bacteriocin-protection protein [Pseudoalteromonas sp. NBT06-2]|uniref:YdeI/OmpD-associated family protein n=1 Tax=Pseudoalteromonas sp. NBT06-2 TaxID=2025950 RepID=UPI000BA74EFB|nr:YdeI/OmpD-associated family protein [Pseudoalteromonas sp. NBT06-2]PAJ72347.1 bacteriocin-protection protein [Pseudoalteromonas sp. NBT06-2]
MVDVIFFKNQEEFNNWLKENTEVGEVWLGYFKKNTGVASLTWSESVDVALCFGWIDGIRKTIDKQSYKIRFTPRKMTSVWSAVNVEKVKALIKLGKMKQAGMHLFNNRTDAQGYSSEQRNVQLSREYEENIKVNQSAWLFFTNLAPSYKRDSIWWVMSAKKEETRLKRLGILIASSEASLKIPTLRKK